MIEKEFRIVSRSHVALYGSIQQKMGFKTMSKPFDKLPIAIDIIRLIHKHETIMVNSIFIRCGTMNWRNWHGSALSPASSNTEITCCQFKYR